MPKSVELFFDVGSPYSYLAATQIERIAERSGATVAWKPMVLGAVFKATENDMPARCPAKARYMLADLARFAALYGVPFKMSSRFPVNGLRAGRLVVAAGAPESVGALVLALFRAVWVDDRDPSDPAVLADVANGVGLDGAALVGAIDDAAVKDALRANTDDAIARGVFGAPSFFVGDQLFWGNDRLDFVERALHEG